MRWLATLALTLSSFTAGCGSDQRFDAEGFVAAANAEGAALQLGAPLTSADPGAEVYELAVIDAAAAAGTTGAQGTTAEQTPGGPAATAEQGATGPAGAAEEHAGGSLTVTESDDAARAQYARCESTLSLICYRAANVVLIFEDLAPDQRARLNAAISALGSD